MSEQTDGFADQLGRFLGGFFKFFVRLVFVLVLAIAVGAGLYFGITLGLPAIDRAYIQPVRANSAEIEALAARATQSAASNATQIAALQERLTALEVQNDTASISLDEMQVQIATLMPLLEVKAELSAGIEAAQEAIDTLEADLITLQDEAGSQGLVAQGRLDGLAAELEAVQEELAANDFPVARAYADLQLAKVLTLLIRVQVFLFQDNAGLAAADVETARELLLAYQGDPAFEGLDLQPVITRLDLALENLPDFPDRALNDVEIAWELLLEGLQVETEEPGTQAAPPPTPTPTPTPEP